MTDPVIRKYIKVNKKYEFYDKYLDKNTIKKYFKKPIGLYDPLGENVNPFTGQPYKNLYESQIISYNSGAAVGKKVPNTYIHNAYVWTNFTVYEYLTPIIDSIRNNQVTLITAGTGVGKTALTPQIALQAFNFQKKVLCTVPKKKLAKNSAKFASMNLDVELGREVGYFYMGENATEDDTKLIFTTPGSLKSRITGNNEDPYLSEYECIILDEVHERSIETDQLLLMMKTIMEKRPEFRLILMSATVDPVIFKNYFNPLSPKKSDSSKKDSKKNAKKNAKKDIKKEVNKSESFSFNYIDIPGKLFNVDIYYLRKPVSSFDIKNEIVQKIIHILITTASGDILVFIKSGGDGNILCNLLQGEIKKRKLTTINPFCVILESKTSSEQSNLAINEFKYTSELNNSGKKYTRKIVMATNIAESSLTVKGVVYVIDNGYHLESSFFPKTGARSLIETRISQAAATQRKGRAGRTRDGFCYRMYSEEEFNKFDKFPIPDVQKTDITSDVLDIFMLPYTKDASYIKKFLSHLISPPSNEFINYALRKLHILGAIDSPNDNGKITELGKALAKFRAIDINFAKSIMASYNFYCKDEVIAITAICIKIDGRIDNLFHIDIDKRMDDKMKQKQMKEIEKKQRHFYSKYGDYITILNVYTELKNYMRKLPEIEQNIQHVKHWCRENGISSRTFTSSHSNKKSWDVIDNDIKKMKFLLMKILRPFSNKNKLEINKNFLNKNIKITNNNSKKINQNNMTQRFFPESKNIMNDINKEYSHFEERRIAKIICSFAIGHVSNIAILQNAKNSMYQTTFPIEKILCKIDRNSSLQSKAKIVMYYELFTTNAFNKILKMNISTKIEDGLLKILKKYYTI
jgi:HrpA-like RNA helicase